MAYGPRLWALLFPDEEPRLDPFDENPEFGWGGGGGPIKDFGPVRSGGPWMPKQPWGEGPSNRRALPRPNTAHHSWSGGSDWGEQLASEGGFRPGVDTGSRLSPNDLMDWEAYWWLTNQRYFPNSPN